METILADFVAAVVGLGLQERSFMAVGSKSGVFQSLQDCFDAGEVVFIIDSSDQDVVEDAVDVRNPLP